MGAGVLTSDLLPARAATPRKTLGLALRARIELAPPDVMAQITDELSAAGLRNGRIATVPAAYHTLGGGAPVLPINNHPATLHGDVDGDGKAEWVVGCYYHPERVIPDKPGAPDPVGDRMREVAEDDRARIVVFKQDAVGKWKLSWKSPGLGFRFGAPEYNLREVQQNLDRMESLLPPLALVDVDRDGVQEIAYTCWSRSDAVGAMPGVYRWEKAVRPQPTEALGRWMSVAPQADRFSLQDVDQDRVLEVVAGSRYVGYGTGDNDVPRVWKWTGRQFQEASGRYPLFYSQLADRYREHMKSLDASGGDWKRNLWERAYQKARSLAG